MKKIWYGPGDLAWEEPEEAWEIERAEATLAGRRAGLAKRPLYPTPYQDGSAASRWFVEGWASV